MRKLTISDIVAVVGVCVVPFLLAYGVVTRFGALAGMLVATAYFWVLYYVVDGLDASSGIFEGWDIESMPEYCLALTFLALLLDILPAFGLIFTYFFGWVGTVVYIILGSFVVLTTVAAQEKKRGE